MSMERVQSFFESHRYIAFGIALRHAVYYGRWHFSMLFSRVVRLSSAFEKLIGKMVKGCFINTAG